MHFDLAIDKLMTGLRRYKQNEYYYALLIFIYDYLERNNKLSEKNQISRTEMMNIAHKHINESTLKLLINENGSSKLTME